MRSLLRALLWSTSFAAVAVPGCNCDPELERTPGSLAGKVCDPETRQGIPNVAVEVRGPTTKRVPTDGGGNYIADGLLPGNYAIVAILTDGELPVTREGEVAVVVSAETETVTDERCADPPLPPDSGTIDGQICDRHTGELVSDAVVEVIGADSSVLAAAATDDNGNFVIEDVPEGDHVVSIRAPNFSRSFPVTVVIGETITLDLADGACAAPFGAGCTILGSMCDPRGTTGDKLAGATVTVRAREGGATVTDLTDTNGEFYVSALVPGSYDVTVSHPDAGVNEVFSDVACRAGEDAVLVGPDACADRTPVGRVAGQVCILDPNASRGRFVGTVFLKQGVTTVSQVQTDADGAFEFPPVPTGTYDLQLGDPALRLISPVIVNAFQTTFVEEASCPEPQDICADFVHNPDVLSDGRILFVVDRSGSMGLTVSGGSVGATCSAAADCGVDAFCDTGIGRCVQNKWSALKSGLSAVTGGLATTLQYGLFVYPNPGDDNAPIANCSAGAQRQAMGGSAAQINSALALVAPRGGTPTASTMAAALPVIQALQNDARPLAVVLATDGAPNCNNTQPRAGVTNCITQDNGVVTCACTCTSNAGSPPQSDASCALFNCLDTNAFSSAGAIAQIAQLGVQTHVIGIPDANIPAGQLAIFNDALNQMAVAGGAPLSGNVRYHQATNLNALQASLEAVTRRIVACQITVPTPLDGATSIEVRLGTAPIPRDAARRNGWDQTGPTSIQLFGSACDAATASQESVTIKRCARP